MTDLRIAFGARCTWWDGIAKVGKLITPEGSLPCCPHCGGVLFEVPDEETWWKNVDKYDDDHPGYRAIVEWGRGKCFKDYEALYEARETEG